MYGAQEYIYFFLIMGPRPEFLTLLHTNRRKTTSVFVWSVQDSLALIKDPMSCGAYPYQVHDKDSPREYSTFRNRKVYGHC